jgi:hypothetical protein
MLSQILAGNTYIFQLPILLPVRMPRLLSGFHLLRWYFVVVNPQWNQSWIANHATTTAAGNNEEFESANWVAV